MASYLLALAPHSSIGRCHSALEGRISLYMLLVCAIKRRENQKIPRPEIDLTLSPSLSFYLSVPEGTCISLSTCSSRHDQITPSIITYNPDLVPYIYTLQNLASSSLSLSSFLILRPTIIKGGREKKERERESQIRQEKASRKTKEYIGIAPRQKPENNKKRGRPSCFTSIHGENPYLEELPCLPTTLEKNTPLADSCAMLATRQSPLPDCC